MVRTHAWFWGASIPDPNRDPTSNPSGFPPIPTVHLVIRFLLELVMWAGCGMAGWHFGGWIGAVIGVVLSMAVWGVFGTVGDGSRGDPVVRTPARLRLAIEFVLFAVAAYGIWMVWSRAASETFLTVSILHYGITWERQWWLIRGGPMPEVG